MPVSPDVYILSQRDLDEREQKAFKRGVTGGRVTAEGWPASRHRHDNQQRRMKMLKPLKRIEKKCWHFVDGQRIYGVHSGLRGDCSGLSGDCSFLSGNCSGLRGDCSFLSGDCSFLSGDCSGLWGDCSFLSGDFRDIPISERAKTPNINDWVQDADATITGDV